MKRMGISNSVEVTTRNYSSTSSPSMYTESNSLVSTQSIRRVSSTPMSLIRKLNINQTFPRSILSLPTNEGKSY